jgi:hypothetical protein
MLVKIAQVKLSVINELTGQRRNREVQDKFIQGSYFWYTENNLID